MAERFENLVDMFDKSVRKFGAHELFGTKRNDAWEWTTYSEFADKVASLRGGLSALGIKRGDCVAVVSGNRVEWAILAYACYGLGAALVPMYESQRPSEWEFIVNDCSAVALVAGTPAVYEQCVAVAERVPSVKHVVGMELPRDDAASFAALVLRGSKQPCDAISPDSKDTACLLYTSGTTGNPKGVILSHGNITSNINAVQHMLPVGPDDRSLSFLPWAHSFGHTAELHVMLSRGASIALNDASERLLPNLAEVQPTVLFSVPRMFHRVYEGVRQQMSQKPAAVRTLFETGLRAAIKERKGIATTVAERLALPIARKLIFARVVSQFGGKLKYAFSGGAALSTEVAEFVDGLGVTVYEGYGLTETSPIATANRPGAHRIGSVGKPIDDVRIEIDRAPTSPDAKDGEIVVFGPNVMQGYYARPDDNRTAFTADGGFRTGDLGYLDSDGFLYITGRLKELYKLQNGKYVAPVPLEERLKLSPFVANVFVYGDDRPFNVALVVPEVAALVSWARDNALSTLDPRELVNHPRIHALVRGEIDAYGASFKGFEAIRRFALVAEDFTPENGMLTPSLKVKRRVVSERFKSTLDSLYVD